MTPSFRNTLATAFLIVVLMSPAKADTLTNAATELRAKHYSQARQLVIAYYSNGGVRRYRADFIRAASECRLGFPSGLNRLRRLRTDYLLSGTAASEVSRWIQSCQPPVSQTAQSGQNGVGVSAQGLGSEPPTESAAAGNEPRALPRMSPLIGRTAFIGEDYAWPTVATPQACQRLCQLQAPCRSITFDTTAKICWLKRSVPNVGHSDNYVSSVKQGN